MSLLLLLCSLLLLLGWSSSSILAFRGCPRPPRPRRHVARGHPGLGAARHLRGPLTVRPLLVPPPFPCRGGRRTGGEEGGDGESTTRKHLREGE